VAKAGIEASIKQAGKRIEGICERIGIARNEKTNRRRGAKNKRVIMAHMYQRGAKRRILARRMCEYQNI